MPRSITQYRVFIGSPGGLEAERTCFREKLRKFSEMHDDDVVFHPVGWEDTLPGAGRPQALINSDLEGCDYAVFVLHDRWGSATGSGHTSGTEEEFRLAEALHGKKIRNIALFFKKVDPGRLRDPGEQLKPVLAFKKRIEDRKKYLFRHYVDIEQFAEVLEKLLIDWKKAHANAGSGLSIGELTTGQPRTAPSPDSPRAPQFDYWIAEAFKLSDAGNHGGALFCAEKALETAKTEEGWARTRNIWGISQFHLGRRDEALGAFSEIADRLRNSADPDRRVVLANALFNKGVALSMLGRREEEVAAYDDLLARFGAAAEPALREQVAKALFNKGVALGALGRSGEAIAAFDDVLARFGAASEPALREQVAKALFNKGVALGALGRRQEEVAAYDDLLARFGAASEPALREQVAMALFNKGGALGRNAEAIAVYDDVLARFGAASEPALREAVAKAKELRNRLQKPPA